MNASTRPPDPNLPPHTPCVECGHLKLDHKRPKPDQPLKCHSCAECPGFR